MIIGFLLLFLFFGLGFSIWIAMGLSGSSISCFRGRSLTVVASYLVQGVDSPTLIAIPFFILAGELMNKSASPGSSPTLRPISSAASAADGYVAVSST